LQTRSQRGFEVNPSIQIHRHVMARNAAPSERESSEDEQYDSAEEPSNHRATHSHNTRQRRKAASLGGPELVRREPSRDANVPSTRSTRSHGGRDDVATRGKNARPTVTQDRPSQTAVQNSIAGRENRRSHQNQTSTQRAVPYPSDEDMASMGGTGMMSPSAAKTPGLRSPRTVLSRPPFKTLLPGGRTGLTKLEPPPSEPCQTLLTKIWPRWGVTRNGRRVIPTMRQRPAMVLKSLRTVAIPAYGHPGPSYPDRSKLYCREGEPVSQNSNRHPASRARFF
jgi:hypothetical protein